MCPVFLLQIVFLLQVLISADYTMIEVYGKPQSYGAVNALSGYSWKQCIQFCWKTPECVLAYNIKADKCQWFSHGNVSTVKQTLSSNEYVVAFKINSTSTKCLTGINAPTFDNKPVSGSATYNCVNSSRFGPTRFNYTISYSAGLWTIKLIEKTACFKPFWFIQRKTTGFCLGFMGTMVKATPTDSAGYCKLYMNASMLTGAGGSAEEFALAKTQLTSSRSYFQVKDLVVRVDGKRTASCQKTPTSKECKTAKGFTFSDSSSNVIDGYKWATNSGAQKTTASNCIVLVLNKDEEIVADVQSCDVDTTLPAMALVCGKVAWDW